MATSKHKHPASQAARSPAPPTSATQSAPSAAQKTAHKLSPKASPKNGSPAKPAAKATATLDLGKSAGKSATSAKAATATSVDKPSKPFGAKTTAEKPAATKSTIAKPATGKPAPGAKPTPAAAPVGKPATAKPQGKASSAAKPSPPASSKPAEKSATSAAPRAAEAAPGKTAPVRGTPGQIVATPSRTPARSPVGAEELKLKFGALSSATSQIKGLKRSLNKSFFEVGRILADIQEKKLYEVKGYGSFESFVEREIDLGKTVSLRLVRITQTFVREAALAAGLERTTAALAALDGESDMLSTSTSVSAPSASAAARTMLPPHKV